MLFRFHVVLFSQTGENLVALKRYFVLSLVHMTTSHTNQYIILLWEWNCHAHATCSSVSHETYVL